MDLARVVRRNRGILVSYVAAISFLLIMSVVRPGFGLGDLNAFRSLGLEAAVLILIATGQTLVIVSGGIDLSLPWLLTGAAVLMTILTGGTNDALWWAIPLVLGACLVVGLANGLIIAYFRVSPVIATLAMNGILLGVVGMLAGGQIVVQATGYGRAPPALVDLVRGRFLELPNLIWMAAATVVVVALVMTSTTFGRRLYSVGTSRDVSLYSGLQERHITLIVYAISAVLAGLAGMILTAKFGRAFLGMGDPYLFVSVAVVAVGGASVLGGSGHVVGTVAGAILLATLNAAIPVMGLPRAFQLIAFGFVILTGVLFAAEDAPLRRISISSIKNHLMRI